MSDRTPDNVRENPRRLRNLRIFHEDLGMTLEELDEMSEEERREAHHHAWYVAHVLDRMREELGRVGPSREEQYRREQSRRGTRIQTRSER